MRTVEDHDDLTVLDAVESTTSGGTTVVRLVSALMSAGLISVLAWQAAGLTWRTVAPTESIQAAPQWTSRALVPPTSARSDAQREAQLKTIIAAERMRREQQPSLQSHVNGLQNEFQEMS